MKTTSVKTIMLINVFSSFSEQLKAVQQELAELKQTKGVLFPRGVLQWSSELNLVLSKSPTWSVLKRVNQSADRALLNDDEQLKVTS